MIGVRVSAGRFEEADKYAAYLRTVEGRIRTDLAWANLRHFLPANASGFRALDAGGGTGTLAMRLAELGFDVTLLDISEPMLALARKEAEAKPLAGSISFSRGDAVRSSELFEPASFHIVVCHNLLEYLEDPRAVLRALALLLRHDGIVSLLARNRWGEVLKAAVKGHNVEHAAAVVQAESVLDALYGQPVRVFDPEELRNMVSESRLEPLAVWGVRVVSDYVACENLNESDYVRLLDIEQSLGVQPQLAGVARYIQLIARRSGSAQRGSPNGYASIH